MPMNRQVPRPYAPPCLVRLGTVSGMTATGSGAKTEGQEKDKKGTVIGCKAEPNNSMC